jgi:hypothetical protein
MLCVERRAAWEVLVLVYWVEAVVEAAGGVVAVEAAA